ncbi:hypothetical protein [Microbacterium sp.]|uniref:hypothetical protein n=1 Tax=Microbacterium sp. TaxID=51671 RepID=UPI0039E5079D
MTTPARRSRPPLPQPIAWLYVIAVLVLICAAIASVLVAVPIGFPAAAGFVGTMVGTAIAAFVPALLGHGIVIAIHDLSWGRKGWFD